MCAGDSVPPLFVRFIKMDSKLRERIIKTLEWMVADMRWRADQTKRNFEEGSEGGYSPELQEAIDLLAELKGKTDK